MHIIFGKENLRELDQKYTVLALDSFRVAGQQEPVDAYCVIEQIPIEEIAKTEMWRDLHENLIKNYRAKNWRFCEDAIEHLMGRWNGTLDSFYHEISGRISQYKVQDPGDDWDGVIDRT